MRLRADTRARVRGPQLRALIIIHPTTTPRSLSTTKGTSAAAHASTLGLPDFPHHDEVEKVFVDIRGARLGDPTPLVPMNAHPDITKALSEAVTFSFTAAHMYHSMAWFFCQPGVGLDGIGAHFKLAATICSTDGCKSAWVRRGEERGQGETEEPSRLSLHSLRHALAHTCPLSLSISIPPQRPI